jgi:hypothetical protein
MTAKKLFRSFTIRCTLDSTVLKEYLHPDVVDWNSSKGFINLILILVEFIDELAKAYVVLK